MKSKLILLTTGLLVGALFLQIGILGKPREKLNHKKVTMFVGQTKKLKIKNKRKNAKVKWYSKNKSVAKVTKKGKVIAKNVGKTTIIAKVKKKKYKCRVVVKSSKIKESSRNNNCEPVTRDKTTTLEPTAEQPTTENEPTTEQTTTEIASMTEQVTTQSEKDIVSILSRSMNVICHRGYKKLAPENSEAAFRLAKQNGYNIVETDIKYTKDGVPVMLHDFTINRVARNADGSEITEPIDISTITYEEVLNYDFGIYKSEEFKGTKILTLVDFLKLCKELDLKAYLHLFMGTEKHIRDLYDLVEEYGMKDKVTWFSYSDTLLKYVRDYDYTARLELVVGSVSVETISKAEELKKYGNPVVIDSNTYSREEIELCKNANIPMEVYWINSLNRINSLDSYISGVTVEYIW